MDNYYVMVVGSGQSTRANLEALMEDYYYANGVNGTLILPYDKKPSTAQVFAAQYAKDKSIKVLAISTQTPSSEDMYFSSGISHEDPIEHAVSLMKGSKADSFILWNDEDQKCLDALALSSREGIPCFDLTSGLSPIASPGDVVIEKPKFPTQEVLPEPKKVEVILEDDEEEEYEDEDEEEEEEELEDEEVPEQLMDDLYFGVQAFAKLIAAEVAKILQEGPEKPSEGSEA